MKFFKDSTRLIGLVFLIFSIWVIAVSSGFKEKASQLKLVAKDPIGPGLFPIAVGVAIAVLSVILIITGDKKKKAEEEGDDKPGPVQWKTLFIVIASMGAYSFFFSFFGYIITTILFIFGLSMLFERTRWKTAILYSLIGTAMWYLVFKVGLKILLPTIWL